MRSHDNQKCFAPAPKLSSTTPLRSILLLLGHQISLALELASVDLSMGGLFVACRTHSVLRLGTARCFFGQGRFGRFWATAKAVHTRGFCLHPCLYRPLVQSRGAGFLGWLQAGHSGLGFGVGPSVFPARWVLQVGAALLWEAWAAGCFWGIRVCGVGAPQRTGNIRKTSKRVRITWRHFVGPWRALFFQAIGW